MKRYYILVITILVFSLSGCAEKPVDIGTIENIDPIIESSTYDDSMEEKMKEDYITLNNGYSGMSLTVPNWKIEVSEANLIKLTNENTTIFIEHSSSKYNEHIEGYELNEAIASFDGAITVEEFNIDNHIYTRRADQTFIEREGPEEINNGDLVVLRYDIPDLNYYGEKKMSESRYYIFNKNISTMIAIISPAELYEESCQIIDDIYLSISDFKEELQSQELSISNRSLMASSLFQEFNEIYKVPSSALSALSECVIYSIDGDFDSYEPGDLFTAAFPVEAQYCENRYMRYPMSEGIINATGYTDKRRTECMVYRTALGGDRLISHLMTYYFDEYEFEDTVVILGYPYYSYNAIKNAGFSIF